MGMMAYTIVTYQIYIYILYIYVCICIGGIYLVKKKPYFSSPLEVS